MTTLLRSPEAWATIRMACELVAGLFWLGQAMGAFKRDKRKAWIDLLVAAFFFTAFLISLGLDRVESRQQKEREAKFTKVMNELAETRAKLTSVEPLNLPIGAVSASAMIIERGNTQAADPLIPGAANLTIGFSEQPGFWRPGLPWQLSCTSFHRTPLNNIDTIWTLTFSEDLLIPTLGGGAATGGFGGALKDSGNWDCIKFGAAFLPRGTEVV